MQNLNEQLKNLSERFPDSAGEIAKMANLRCSSVSELADRILSLPDTQAALACWIVGQLGGGRDIKRLIPVFKSGRDDLWWPCGMAIGGAGGASFLNGLEKLTRPGNPPLRREAAAYALSCLSYDMLEDVARWVDVFLNILEDDDSPAVCGHACEGLGNLLWHVDGRLAPVRKAKKHLVEALKNDSPEIRFWAAFALGKIGSRTSIPALRKAAKDKTLHKGWWTVGEEAQDAITEILGGVPPEREMQRG